jgi:hypothetical protein
VLNKMNLVLPATTTMWFALTHLDSLVSAALTNIIREFKSLCLATQAVLSLKTTESVAEEVYKH